MGHATQTIDAAGAARQAADAAEMLGAPARDVAVSVAGVSKMYPLYDAPGDRLKQAVRNTLARAVGRPPRHFYREFWALRGVSFTVHRGEALGIIGQNGSGKSTLLQIIAGTTLATTGQVTVDGRVSALLELGSGFNPEFTGRENVFLYGSILGLSDGQMAARYDEIAAFAQIGQFIDQPLKTYSSGMQVRLAFAVAACVDPDVLIIDEALAVGDALYQSRCYRRLQELREAGRTIILVTHDSHTVQSFCDRAVLLDRGELVKIGPAKPVVNKYTQLIAEREREYVAWLTGRGGEASAAVTDTAQEDVHQEYRYGTGEAEILSVRLLDDCDKESLAMESGATASVAVRVRARTSLAAPIVAFTVHTPTGVLVAGTNTWYGGLEPAPQPAGQVTEVRFTQRLPLGPGDYILSAGVVERREGQVVPLDRRYDVLAFKVLTARRFAGLVDLESRIDVRTEVPEDTAS
jgi:lipopolysaccharide transport system ATP-binding protein